jgi:hemerythrin superfamily protein
MNVIDLLKSDHDKVNGLFKSFESAKKSDSASEKQHLVEQICQELEVHATVEEQLFYPAVEKRAAQDDEKAESSVKESYEEHSLVKTVVAELKGGSARADGELDAKVKVLKDLVEHHVEEEEGILMPRAKKLLTSEELDELGTQAESRKQELLRQASAGPERAQPRSRRSSSSGGSSSKSASSKASSGSSRTSRSSSTPSRRRSTASSSSRSSRSSGVPRASRGRSSSKRGSR